MGGKGIPGGGGAGGGRRSESGKRQDRDSESVQNGNTKQERPNAFTDMRGGKVSRSKAGMGCG